jgi:hypothetical protein
MVSCMNNCRLHKLVAILLLLVAGFSSCKSKRSLIKAPLKAAAEQFLLDQMKQNEVDFQFFNARTTVSYSGDARNKIDLKGQIRIQKDSLIWISLSPMLNIEAARIVITPDSVKFFNRIDKTYFVGDYAFIHSNFSSTINFDMLQSLLLGNDLSWYETDGFRASVDGGEYRLSATKRKQKKRQLKQQEGQGLLVHNIWLQPETFKIVKLNIREYGDDNKKLNANFDSFTDVNGQMIPADLNFEISTDKKIKLRMQYSRIELDQNSGFPFRIPDNFTKLK